MCCGILGIIAPRGSHPNLNDASIARLRDQMFHRGPDEEGRIIRRGNVIMAHRRLAVIDLQHGSQPMWSSDEMQRFLLVYNGELYNDVDLRAQLSSQYGVRFETRCDTETILHAFACWGVGCLPRLRGMFALGIYDFEKNILTLARDPLGIKPLYWSQPDGAGCRDIIFASQIRPILAHPHQRCEPNMPVVSSYLTTIRTTLGDETMYAGVRTLRPGQVVQFHFEKSDELPRITEMIWWSDPVEVDESVSFDEAVQAVRATVTDSIRAHLRSDVPRCMLLSGGLDSAIIAAVCARQGGQNGSDLMRTWCAGDAGDVGGDRHFARQLAACLGTDHHEILIDEPRFHEIWRRLIDLNALPLSTPNETAIYAVAEDLKPHATVALSGEGADELFAGYAQPILSGLDGLRLTADRALWPGGEIGRARYLREIESQYGVSQLGSAIDQYLRTNSWISREHKPLVLLPEFVAAAQGDSRLLAELRYQFEVDEGRADECTPERLLGVHRRLNLSGLLARLDSSTMAASVEGRTPFADRRVAELAMSLPFAFRMQVQPHPEDGGWMSADEAIGQNLITTKYILRKAFEQELPALVLKRPKASFPLPFENWLKPAVDLLARRRGCGMVQPLVAEELAKEPGKTWIWAWPLANIALWFERMWGNT